MPLTYTKLMSAMYSYFEGPPLVFYWDDGYIFKAIDETGAFETDNLLEEDDPNYLEYYAVAVKILEVISPPNSPTPDEADIASEIGGLWEISSEFNEPLKIETLDGKVIWQRGD